MKKLIIALISLSIVALSGCMPSSHTEAKLKSGCCMCITC